MNYYWVYSVGLLAQLTFAARLLVQWIKSEKAGKVLSPTLFWQLSLLGSILMMIYGLLRSDLVIILGQIFSYLVYLRNLQHRNTWAGIPMYVRLLVFTFPLTATGFLWLSNSYDWQQLLFNPEISSPLLLWGTVGQCMFTFRFIYQWFFLENHGRSTLPLGFWIISIIGSLMILSYATLRSDPVLFLGQSFGAVIYARNILIHIKSTSVGQPN